MQLLYFWFGVKYMSINKKQTIGIIVNDINFFFSHRVQLAEKLSKEFKVFVISDISSINESKLKKYDFVEFIHLKSRLNKNIFINIMSLARYGIWLVGLLRSKKIDNVFFITLEISMIGAIASKFLKSKNYFVISGAYILREKQKIKSIATKIFNLLESSKNKFVFQNNMDQLFFEDMLGKKHNSFLIKGNGIDLQKINFAPMPKTNRIRFLFASNLLYTKGVREYYDAAVRIKSHGVDADFFIAGNFNKDHPLSIKESLFDNIIQSSALEYLGSWDQNTFLKKISDYHVFVLPSYGEGMPLAILEAMASGRAIISTNAAGCIECIREGLNGYSCKATSSESLLKNINAIIENKNHISEMGFYSRKIIQNEFDLNLIYKKYVDLIKA